MSELQAHLNTLSEPTRVRLLAVLEHQELDVGELTRVLQLPQSTVSRHLKALQLAGWIRRRAEGTSGLFRMQPDALVDRATQLWVIVRDDFHATHQAEEDQSRLHAVLDARRIDSRTFFGHVREEWDALRHELFGDDFLLPTLLSLLPEGLVAADLGCGTGEALAALAPVCARVIGVDQEQAMLDTAAVRVGHLPGVELRRGGLEDLPLADGEVDVALCMLVLHHVVDPGRAFREIQRALKPGGRAVVLDMVAHDREAYRQTMGHQHLGFSEATVAAQSSAAGLALTSWRLLPPSPDAQGPPLFIAVLTA
ncbi:MAG: metalloregulator ArsR/SmtB family transcription factor [Deltaproteobacteria bacterium]|nr:metalloregulator ArsR/SmtB family transcription factor [Deltaproteobacteria bacterium]